MADIKQKIKLEGEKEYVAALREADRNLKTLRSALKAETAELGNNATEQEKNNVKAKNLKKQIAEQTKVVETQRKALAEVQKNYSDNAEAIALYEKKLYEARYTLADLQNQLDKTNTSVSESGQALKQAGAEASLGVVATKSFADSLGNIADVAGSISDSIQGIFEGMISGIKSAIGQVWGDMMDLAAKANDWEDLATTWNTTATNIQKWYHAVRASHNDFSTLSSTVMRIATADPEKLVEYAKVSSENYTDQWELAMAVMDSLSKMDYDERLTAMTELFGARRVEGVSDLVGDWATILKNLEEFDVENGGIGMTEEDLSTMSELAEQVDHIKESWETFKGSFETQLFGKISLDMTSNVQGALDAFIKFMNTDDEKEREQALKDLETNLTDFFRHLGEAIGRAAEAIGNVGEELAGSEDSGVALVGKALQTLADILEWFTVEDNINLVIKALETLAAFWIVGKGAEMAGRISSVVSDISLIRTFSGLRAGKGLLLGNMGAAAGAGASAVSEVTLAIEGMGGTVATAIAGVLSSTVMQVSLAAIMAVPLLNYLNKGNVMDDVQRGVKWIREFLENPVGSVTNPIETENKLEAAGINKTQDSFKFAWNWLLNNGTKDTEDAVEEAVEEGATEALGRELLPNEGQNIGSGVTIPVKRTPQGSISGYEVTSEQYALAEAMWDALREYSQNPNDETEDTYLAAQEAFEASLAGQEETLQGLNDLVDWLYGQDNGLSMEDLPASWMHVGNEDGITRNDVQSMNSALSGLGDQVRLGASQGVSGIRVYIDGAAAGRLIAPYVDRELASRVV